MLLNCVLFKSVKYFLAIYLICHILYGRLAIVPTQNEVQESRSKVYTLLQTLSHLSIDMAVYL